MSSATFCCVFVQRGLGLGQKGRLAGQIRLSGGQVGADAAFAFLRRGQPEVQFVKLPPGLGQFFLGFGQEGRLAGQVLLGGGEGRLRLAPVLPGGGEGLVEFIRLALGLVQKGRLAGQVLLGGGELFLQRVRPGRRLVVLGADGLQRIERPGVLGALLFELFPGKERLVPLRFGGREPRFERLGLFLRRGQL